MKYADRGRARRITAEDYGSAARLWDRYWVPAYSPAREKLIDLARLKLGERVLDVGTGTGPTAVVAADLVGETGNVLAIDNSRGMLAVAKTKARKLGLTNLKFRLTGLTSLRLPAGSFDAVISSYGMPDLPSDVDPALALLFMVLRPGGRLCFCEKAGEPEKIESTLRELLLRYRVARANPKLKDRRRLETLEANERNQFGSLYHTDASTIKDAVETAGFTNVRVLTESFLVKFPDAKTYVGLELSSWSRSEYAAMPYEVKQEFASEALRALSRFESSEGLTWSVEVNFCSGRK